jgi:hypothetical protein
MKVEDNGYKDRTVKKRKKLALENENLDGKETWLENEHKTFAQVTNTSMD